MAYKDKDKQREYQCNWVRQKRSSTSKGSTGVTPKVEPDATPNKPTFTVIPTEHRLRQWQGPLTKQQQTSQKGYND